MNRKLLSQYGLKYNPFCAAAPVEAFYVTDRVEEFCWRVENQLREGGFAQILGEPGSGKSVALRILCERLSKVPDIAVAMLSRPHASLSDFYRELGDVFSVELAPHNRWAGTKVLRQKWLTHIDSSILRPLLIIDEAQEMSAALLNELRLLSTIDLDAKSILTVVLSGDQRLVDKLQKPDLRPLAGRIRSRLRMDRAERDELREALKHALDQSGNPSLMAKELMNTLSEHAMGNYRAMMNMANELLTAAVRRDLDKLDEKLFLELMQIQPRNKRGRRA